jgi:hypothetical protein
MLMILAKSVTVVIDGNVRRDRWIYVNLINLILCCRM